MRKADTYAAFGVTELWLVDEIKETREVRTLRGDRYGDGELFAKEDQLTFIGSPGNEDSHQQSLRGLI